MTSDFAFEETPKLSLELAPEELAGVIESLHDGVLRRIRWSTYSDQNFDAWRQLDLEIVQSVLRSMVDAYGAAVMLYRDGGFKNAGSFEAAFMWPEEIFDIVHEILEAPSWDAIELHPVHSPESCKVCCTIFGN